MSDTTPLEDPELRYLSRDAIGWDIPDPAFLLSAYGQRLRARGMQLHPWQTRFHLRYAAPFDYKARTKRMALVANNGSGKSAMVLAPCSVFTAMRYNKARVVITSASGTQLDRQTGRSITSLCESVNAVHSAKLWEMKYRNYTFGPTGSTIEMYATDEAGKAEGYHPHDDSPSNIFAVFCDEAKSITDAMFEPVERQTGKSHWILVSSPGAPKGFFYRATLSDRWETTRVTAYDCPHIRQDEIDGAKEAYGEYSPFFRSAYLAEFTSVDEQVIIPYEILWKQIKNPPPFWDDGIVRVGVDLSGGGDENVVSVWQGNKQLALECFRFSDLVATRVHLATLFKKWGVHGSNVFIDHGHVGAAIISELRHAGFPDVRAVMFGGTPYNNVAYGNRGTELWWNFSRFLSHLILLSDKTQTNQLSSRYYKQSELTQKIVLESKREARAKGHHSPDRADATVLAFAGLSLDYFNRAQASEQRAHDNDIIKPNGGLNIARIREGRLTEEEFSQLVYAYREQKRCRAAWLAEQAHGAGSDSGIMTLAPASGSQENASAGISIWKPINRN